MCKLNKISTKDMSREDWLMHRRNSIGGSDAGALMGLSKYASPYSLWAEKTGEVIPEDISDREAVRLGNDLEQYVAERWMEATGKKLRRENNILINPDYPFAHANIDRAVIGEPDAGFEAKTTSSYDILKRCREGDFPETWYCQMTHYMMVTGAKRWYLGVLVFGHGFFHFTIERNEAEIEALANAERDFWFNHVLLHIPPSADGSEATMAAIRTIYAEGRDDMTAGLDHMEAELRIYTEAGKRIKELEQQRDEAAAKVMAFMGQAEKGMSRGFRVSWKSQTRNTFDRKKFEKERGAIPEAYFKTSSSRPFKVTEI